MKKVTHYPIGFFSTFLKTPYFSPHYFLQCIMHMTISVVIMQVTVSVVAIYVAVSSNNFIFICLTGTHFSQFAFHHFCKYSSKIDTLRAEIIYKSVKRVIQYFCFLDRPMKGGDIVDFQKWGNHRKGGLTYKRGGGMTPFNNYDLQKCR